MRKRSVAWSYFEKDINDASKALCHLCSEPIAHNGNTTNMMKHLKNKHPEEVADVPTSSPAPKRKSTVAEGVSQVEVHSSGDSFEVVIAPPPPPPLDISRPRKRDKGGKMGAPLVYLTRVQSFSAAHRLHSKKLSDEDNQVVFGKCNHVNGHGHNYKVEVTVKGRVNMWTGMVVNINELKQWIQSAVMDTMDHKNIDIDVPYFKDVISTAENITIFIWMEIDKLLPDGVSLHEIKLFETDKNVVIFRGEHI